jgi:D-lactate dehydrogenase (quinone)
MSNAQLISDLERIVGARHVLTTPSATRRFRKGFRFGDGPALAVVRPGSLVEMWRSLRACSEAGKIVLMQAANTGLTGGSTPDGDTYDREIVIISTLRVAKIHEGCVKPADYGLKGGEALAVHLLGGGQ